MSERDLSVTEQIAGMSPAQLSLLVQRLLVEVTELRAVVAARDVRIAELEAALERRQRDGKRQAAPFSKGKTTDEAKTAGRRSGDAHGRHGHRRAPAGKPDRQIPVCLPGLCWRCGGRVDPEQTASQLVEDLPPVTAMLTEFLIEVGRCRDCGTRVQGRHPDQASDALGAARVRRGHMDRRGTT